jgi:hypothetical protein
MPMLSDLLKLTPGVDLPCVLVPRAVPTRPGPGVRGIHQRCFQVVDESVHGPVAHKSKEDLIQFIQAVAEQKAAGFGIVEDGDDRGEENPPDADEAARSDAGASPWSGAVASIYTDAVLSKIYFRQTPAVCPSADDASCEIQKSGFCDGRLHVSSAGCRALRGQRYYCKRHRCRWCAPRGASSIDCNIVGDVVGQNYLVSGDFWPEALSLFEDTENYRVVEKMLRRRTVASVTNVVAEHSLSPGLSKLEGMMLQAALSAFIRSTPHCQTVKRWLLLWTRVYLGPLVPKLALALCATHGAIGNIDFSASDARQLRAIGHGHRKERRTFGGITGLADVPLLPDLYAKSEDRLTIESLILTWLSLLQRQGLRPIGVNVDDLGKTFKLVAGCLQAGLPGLVLMCDSSSAAARKHLQTGGIVIDMPAFKVLGFELGQDSLHVYYRIAKTINTKSIDAAWAFRCLRKWLGSTNPEVRFGRDAGDAGRDAEEDAPCSSSSSVGAGDWRSVLGVYFQGDPLPAGAFESLKAAVAQVWQHPVHGLPLPPPAKVVLLEDAARAAKVKDPRFKKPASLAFHLVYSGIGHLTPLSVGADLLGVAALFDELNFAKTRGSFNPEWYLAQMRFLAHRDTRRMRPAGPHRRARGRPASKSARDEEPAPAVQNESGRTTTNPRAVPTPSGRPASKAARDEEPAPAVQNESEDVRESRGEAESFDLSEGEASSSSDESDSSSDSSASSSSESSSPSMTPDLTDDDAAPGLSGRVATPGATDAATAGGSTEPALPATLDSAHCSTRRRLASHGAAGCRLQTVVANQLQPWILNGLSAAYRSKLWALQNGRVVSLGTVGKERDWRNKQRRARNKARSRADVPTVNLLLLQRYVQEVAARTGDGTRREQKRKVSRPDLQRDMALVDERVAAALLHGAEHAAPLALAPLPESRPMSTPEDVGYIHSMFREGRL